MDYSTWVRIRLPWLCKKTVNVPDLLLQLISKGLVNETQKAKIEQQPGNVMRAQELYTHLVKFGLARVPDIIAGLDATDNLHVGEEFRKCSSHCVESEPMSLDSFCLVDEPPLNPRKPSLPNGKVLGQKWWPEHKDMIKSFVDRSAFDDSSLVDHLRQQLLNSQAKATAIVSGKQAIVGMGGIGKTSVAKWFANKYQDEYDHVIWMDSEGSSLGASIERLGRKLGLSRESNVSLEEFVKIIYERLQTVRCLFVFDNAERLHGDNGLKVLLPRNEHHHSIITSRNHEWGNPNEFGKIPTFPLDVFTHTECMTLLSKTLRPIGKAGTEAEMLALGEELGFLPLALQCAVATIMKSSRYTLTTYLARIRGDLKILLDKKILNEYERSISATLNLSINHIECDDEINDECIEWCKTVLYVAAYCEPNGIHEALFLGLSEEAKDMLGDAIDVLLQYSLISQEERRTILGRTFGIHRLLQHVIRQKANADSENAIRALKLFFQSAQIDPAVLNTDGACVWNLAAEQFEDVRRTCHEFTLRVHPDNRKFFKTALANLRREFKDTDMPVLQVLMRLMRTDKVALEPAQQIHESLCHLIGQEHESVPFIDELKLHLRAIDLEIKCALIEQMKAAGISTTTEEARILKSYANLLKEMEETGYDGVMGDIKLHYPSHHHLQHVSLRSCVSIRYAVQRSRVNAIEGSTLMYLDQGVLSTCLEKESIEGLGGICDYLSETAPNLLHEVIPTLYKMMRRELIPDTGSVPRLHVRYVLSISWSYYMNCLHKNGVFVDLLDLLEFLSTLPLADDFVTQMHCTYFFYTLHKLTYVLEKQQQPVFSTVKLAVSRVCDALHLILDARQTISTFWILSTVRLNIAYTYVLMHTGNLEDIFGVDGAVTRVIDADIDLQDTDGLFLLMDSFRIDDLILPMSIHKHVDMNRVLESKLHLLLTVCRKCFDLTTHPDQYHLFSALRSLHDSACYITVHLRRSDEAVQMWKENMQLILRSASNGFNRPFIQRMGWETVFLVHAKMEPRVLQLFMNMLAECVQCYIERPCYNIMAVATLVRDLISFGLEQRTLVVGQLLCIFARNSTTELGRISLAVISERTDDPIAVLLPKLDAFIRKNQR